LNYALISILSYNQNLHFTYQTDRHIELGDIVLVELRNKKVWGIIIDIVEQPQNYLVKPLLDILPLNKNYKVFINKLANYYLIIEYTLYKKIITQLLYHTKKTSLLPHQKNKRKELLLNTEQQKAFNTMVDLFSYKTKKPCLLHGITGSGKTYIYIGLIIEYLQKNKSVICLFPNANLAHTVLEEIKIYVDNDICYEYHSHGSKESRVLVWQSIIENKAILICGVHIPLFLPLSNLGCIIIDEEHDLGYIENRFPYINIKEASLIRAQIENIPILLSSATPSLSSFCNAKENKYSYLKLENRHYNIQLPKLSIINMNKKEKKQGISLSLEHEIRETILKNEQTLLFFNKKGLYRYAECSKCDYKFCCNQCSILLTIFSHHIAQCNRCKYKIILPDICPICKKNNEIKTIGYGLGKLTLYLESLFPEAKIIAIDGDILKNKINAEKIIQDINNKYYDIILGTQIITKGYNFNAVSLVGIINADQNFSIPHFMIMEETIQQYIQVAGRAGRKEGRGKVLLQTFSDMTYLENYLKEDNYLDFINFELSFRKSLELPPYIKMALLLVKQDKDELSAHIIKSVYQKIIEENADKIKNNDLIVQLPEKSLLQKIKNKYYYQITLKGRSYSIIQNAIKKTIYEYNQKKTILFFIPNPVLTHYE
jgi:primosomal protein N' (replication factor Y)